MAPSTAKRVLITGAAGRIGRSMSEQLAGRYRLRLQYHRSIPNEHRAAAEQSQASGKPVAVGGDGTEVFLGSAEDLAAMERACAGVDAIVHLAGDPRVEAPWDSILAANIVGLHNTFEAGRRAGVPKLIFASSNHATGFYEKEGHYTTPEMPVRPDSDYGISKAFGEAVGRYYSDAFGMSVVCLRIGSFQERPRNVRHLSTWLSERDCAQLVWRGIESDVHFAVVYGISGNTRAYWDITSARVMLGYEPEDDGERYAAELVGQS